jgi:hypothetical protein
LRRAVYAASVGYEITTPFTVDQKALLEAKTNEQVRSVSSYVAKLIVEALGRR